MKTSEAYDRYILKAEKNAVNDGISTDKRRFIELYNEFQIRYFEYIYDKKNEDDFRYIESLLIPEFKISNPTKSKETYSFKLPDNYLDFSSVYALGSKGSCINKRIDLPKEINDIDKSVFMIDADTMPHFGYRESFYTIGSGNVNVFYTDFSLETLYLSYYRYPKKLKLLNPNNPESDFDDSFDIDFDDKSINKIISAAVSGFDVNNNSERWQINNLFAKQDI